MQNARLDESQPVIKTAGRNIYNLRCADDTLMAKSKKELKSLLMRLKEDSEKFGLKHNIKKKLRSKKKKTKIMASGPTISWQIEEEKVETTADFIFTDSKITADGDCSYKIKRRLFWKKAMINLDSTLKSRDITLPTKVRIVKAIVFPIVVCRCESWTIKKLSTEELMLSNCAGEKS